MTEPTSAEWNNLFELLRGLPDDAATATDEDTVVPESGVDLLAVIYCPRTRAGIEAVIWGWEHRVRRPGGLIVLHDFNNSENPDDAEYSAAISEWLRRRAELWQAAQTVGHQLVVRARARR